MHSALQSILTQQTLPDKQLNGKNGHKQWLLDAELCVQDQVVHTTLPFSPSLWKALDAEHSTYLELPADGGRLYGIVSKYIIQGPGKYCLVSAVNSFCVETNQKNTFFDPTNELNVKSERNHLTLGIGLHELNFEGHKLRLLHQVVGKPVGTNCSAERYRSLIVFAPRQDGSDILKRFCDALIEWDERITEKVYRIYSFNTQRQYWRDMATKLVRPVDSVILPSALKDRILKDVDNFVAPETAKWYYRHGISYKRTYLFYGPPGAGKSSFIRVLAGHLGKNLCFLQPANPGMTDEALQLALQQAPENSIIVIEDIDALFAKDRKSLSNECPLTFSGLLNALDGVCNKDGQLFILTTNYIDRLDSALIRPGRVDQRVEFPNAKPDQIRSLFLHFYNGEEDCADKFTAEIVSRFSDGQDGVKLSMAALQQHFIICRTSTAQEAVANLSDFEGFGSD